MAVSHDRGNGLHYQIPSWFLENNVKISAETAHDEFGLAIVDEVLGGDDGEKRPAGFEILRDDYDAIQLTAAAALIRDEADALLAKTPTILLDMKKDGDTVPGGVCYFDCLVKRLVRDLEADLISVSPENLENLGREFYLQDQKRQEDTTKPSSSVGDVMGNSEISVAADEQITPPEQPEQDSPYALAQFYFGVRSKRKGTAEAQKRNKSAIDALLNSVRIKRISAFEKEAVDDRTPDPPVLLHLTNLKLLDNYRPRYRFLRRFASRLEERRTVASGASQRILGIASEASSSSIDTERRKFFSDYNMTFQISLPPNYSVQEAFYERSDHDYIRANNVRRFKEILQVRLMKAFEPGVLALHESEDIRQRWLKEVFPGKKVCSMRDLKQAAMQVAGRQWGKPTLNLDDVVTVASRMSRKGIWDVENELEEEQGSDQQDSWEGLTLKQRQDRVSEQCNSYEKKLLDCIVDPEELATTFDDVILDGETKQHVKQLVNLSRIIPEAASKTLLQDLCISGALFYGAPGTGKTLLCKAIANDSSSNMLALSPANIQNKYVGETEKIISAVFSLAAKLSPCVLFIDDVDALFYRRGDSDRSWERSALNQLLQEMDGLTTRNKGTAPFVIVGTNRPGDLDDAFLRRLPHKVLFTLPAAAERELILRTFLHHDDIDQQLDLNDLAKRTNGFSGSDLRSLCGHAALAWAVEQTQMQPSTCISTLRVHLQRRHFGLALRKTKPTVSAQSTTAFKEFASRFNPENHNVRATDP